MTPALQQRLDEARARTKQLEARTDLERPRRDIDWTDIGKSALTGARSGLESTVGGAGDIGALQKDITSYAADKLGLSPEAAKFISTYTNPLSLLPSSEDVGAFTDQFTGRDDYTRHVATTPQGQNIQSASEFASGLIGGPENMAKDLGIKAATMTPEAMKFAALMLLPRHGFGRIGEEAVETGAKTLKHQMFDNNLPIPVEDLSAKYSARPMKTPNIIRPEDLNIGDVLIPGVGDTSLAGHDIHELGGKVLDKPVNMHGGGDFGLDNPEVWASAPAQIARLGSDVEEAAKLADGNRVLLANTLMGGQSVDFAHMPAELVRQQLKDADLGAAEEAFNKFMREEPWSDYDAIPDFPGLKSDELADYLVGYGKGDARKKMVKGAAQAKRWKGTPLPASVEQARWASIDPDLLNEPSGMVGRSFSEVKPGGVVTNPERPNLTYPHHYAGEHTGRFEKLVPRDIVFRDWWKRQAGKTNRSQIDRSQLMSRISQPVDQQMIDEMSHYMLTGEMPKR